MVRGVEHAADEPETWWRTLAQAQQEALDDQGVLLAEMGPARQNMVPSTASPVVNAPSELTATEPCAQRSQRTDLFPPLPTGTYSIIYADPPWDYKGQLQHNGPSGRDSGGAERHYPTVKLDDLKLLRVRDIAAADCLLFMWATNPHLDQAIELGKAWGFAWATVAFVWDKRRVNPGFYTMSQCELCLVFKRGRIPRPRGARNVRQLVTEERRAHSEKPDEVRERINAMFPEAPKIELFARTGGNNGWTVWGLDAEGHSERQRQ